MLHGIGHFLAPSMHHKLSWSEEATMADTNNTHLTSSVLVQKPFYSLPIRSISSCTHTWHTSQDFHHITFETAVVPKFMPFCLILHLGVSRSRWNFLGHSFLRGHGILVLLGWSLDFPSNSFGWMSETYIWNVVWDNCECVFWDGNHTRKVQFQIFKIRWKSTEVVALVGFWDEWW